MGTRWDRQPLSSRPVLDVQECLPIFTLHTHTLTHTFTLTRDTRMFTHSHSCPHSHTHVHTHLHTHTGSRMLTLTCTLVFRLIHTRVHTEVCWNRLEPYHESQLLNFQEFCEPVIKHRHCKLNYIKS